MSDLLQRLIDRSREPLSAVRPILPSIYTPAENDGGGISQANPAPEPDAPPPAAPTERADDRGISEVSQPVAGKPIEKRTNPAAPAPPRGEADAPPRPPPPPPGSKTTLQRKDGGIAPAINPLARVETGSPPPETKAVPSANENPGGKAAVHIHPSITKTIVPRGLVSRSRPLFSANKDAATIRKILPWPKETASATPAETKAVSSAFETGQGDVISPPEPSTPKTTVSPGLNPKAVSSHKHNDADLGAPTNRESFSARQTGGNSKKISQDNNRTPPVEVHVSIGHIEVRSAQPQAPAPRRTPPRPRVTLDEFLKRPHYGGPV